MIADLHYWLSFMIGRTAIINVEASYLQRLRDTAPDSFFRPSSWLDYRLGEGRSEIVRRVKAAFAAPLRNDLSTGVARIASMITRADIRGLDSGLAVAR
jgi:hypothetical protein